MHQITWFWPPKVRNLPTLGGGGGTPLPRPSLGLGRSAPSHFPLQVGTIPPTFEDLSTPLIILQIIWSHTWYNFGFPVVMATIKMFFQILAILKSFWYKTSMKYNKMVLQVSFFCTKKSNDLLILTKVEIISFVFLCFSLHFLPKLQLQRKCNWKWL